MFALIVKYTIVEAYKKHLFTLLSCAFIACIVLAYYVKSISITEGSASFIYFYNAIIRVAIVFLLAWYCIITQGQIFEKARIQIQMSLPMSRGLYCIANLVAYICIAVVIAIVASIPLFISEYHAGLWLLTLIMELSIAVSLAYVMSFVFKQSTVAISCFTLIYIFARNAAEFTRHADNVLPSSNGVFEVLSLWFIKLVALIVPKLENYANSSVLEHGIELISLPLLMLETVLYIGLLYCIAHLEMRKKIL